jgi:UDP-N-acetylglucosamine 2-epimerase (non-hydrolysing)
MNKIKIALVVGARPNFMKAAPLLNELKKHSDSFETTLIHTGQHYDRNLSQLFFDDLKMPEPDIYLGAGSGTHAQQTSAVMVAIEEAFFKLKPDLTIVFGDINSTLATAVVAAKLHIKLAHVEAGLRSFDNRMPEEINRIVTDRLSDFLFVTEQVGIDNLLNEGVPEDKMFLCGNIMIDSLKQNIQIAEKSDILSKLSIEENNYITVTLHRPSNVDDSMILNKIINCLTDISKKTKVVFPCHPRTVSKIKEFGINNIDQNNLKIIEPLGYLDFLKLVSHSKLVISDSGGLQADTTFLNVPCLTLRDTTEQPSTIEFGTNQLCGTDPDLIKKAVDKIITGEKKKRSLPPLWDGETSVRIVKILKDKMC